MKFETDMVANTTRKDIPHLASVVAAAMELDPLHAWFFKGRNILKCNSVLYTYVLADNLEHATVIGKDPDAVAIWLGPNTGRMSIGKTFRAAVPAIRLVTGIGPARIGRMYSFYHWASEQRHAIMNTPERKRHLYLMLIAVDPAMQGKGVAGKLMLPGLYAADSMGCCCCLETQNARNVPIYEHYGFSTALKTEIPGSRITHWIMVREPVRKEFSKGSDG